MVEISKLINQGMDGIGNDTGQINAIITQVSGISEKNEEAVTKVMKYLSQLSF